MDIVDEQVGGNKERIETDQSIPLDLMPEKHATKNQEQHHLQRTERSAEQVWREGYP